MLIIIIIIYQPRRHVFLPQCKLLFVGKCEYTYINIYIHNPYIYSLPASTMLVLIALLLQNHLYPIESKRIEARIHLFARVLVCVFSCVFARETKNHSHDLLLMRRGSILAHRSAREVDALLAVGLACVPHIVTNTYTHTHTHASHSSR